MGGNQVLVSRGAFSEDATLSFSTAAHRGLTQDLGQYDQVNPATTTPVLCSWARLAREPEGRDEGRPRMSA